MFGRILFGLIVLFVLTTPTGYSGPAAGISDVVEDQGAEAIVTAALITVRGGGMLSYEVIKLPAPPRGSGLAPVVCLRNTGEIVLRCIISDGQNARWTRFTLRRREV